MASWSSFRGIRLRELKRKKSVDSVLPGLDFTLDEASMRALTEQFKEFPGAVQQAILLATDRTRMAMRNELVRSFKGLTTLKPAYIGKGIRGKKARPVKGGALAELRIASSAIPLSRYEVDPGKPPRLQGVPVASRKRTSYRLRIGGRNYGDTPHGAHDGKLFVQRTDSGHIGVFYRTGRGIQQQWAPALQYHAYADGFIDRINTLSAARFENAFCEEASRITGVGI